MTTTVLPCMFVTCAASLLTRRRQHSTPPEGRPPWARDSAPVVAGLRPDLARGRAGSRSGCVRRSACATAAVPVPPARPAASASTPDASRLWVWPGSSERSNNSGGMTSAAGCELDVLITGAAPDRERTVAHRDAEASPRPVGARDRRSSIRSAPCRANAPGAGSPRRNGASDQPSACSGVSAPMNSQMVGSTSTDSVTASTTVPRPAVGLRPGVDHDQRDVVALVPVAELLEQPVVAAHLAVVAGDAPPAWTRPSRSTPGTRRARPARRPPRAARRSRSPAAAGVPARPRALPPAASRMATARQRMDGRFVLPRGAPGERSRPPRRRRGRGSRSGSGAAGGAG